MSRKKSTILALAALALSLGAGCAKPVRPKAPEGAELRLGDAWFEARARHLGISVEEARARDEALPEDAPPAGVWDEQTRVEAAALWAGLCARCHGIDGDLEGVPVTDKMPKRKWGTFGVSMGFLFGGDKMRAGIFQRIADGVPEDPASPMIAWREALAKEQIWALVYYLESL